ncbi:MAG: LLM class flavin-dependent oxidoreductase [Acidimicrobiales bacterium]|nr:LLM class flavin-dependent oxidoreductase [Acidimicrobiales bacterium]
MRLSVLDQSPVPEGATAADALANTIDLAQRVEAMGYHRYWVAEHHNTGGLAGSAPEVLIAAIAAGTERIRVGSGGVMLSHYSPLKVAEAFQVLATLYPGRIDLGIGRAPGSDQITAYALAPTSRPVSVERYPNTVNDLLGYLRGELDPDSPFAGKVQATPRPPSQPHVWVLASSADSAAYAAHFGLPLGFAHFITVADGPAIAEAYRQQYQPSLAHPEPEVLVAASLLCAETEADAHRLATSVQAWRSRGLQGPIPPPQELPAPGPLGAVRTGRKAMIVGNPTQAAEQLRDLAEAYGADEAMAVTITWDHEARVRSYELLAEVIGA